MALNLAKGRLVKVVKLNSFLFGVVLLGSVAVASASTLSWDGQSSGSLAGSWQGQVIIKLPHSPYGDLNCYYTGTAVATEQKSSTGDSVTMSLQSFKKTTGSSPSCIGAAPNLNLNGTYNDGTLILHYNLLQATGKMSGDASPENVDLKGNVNVPTYSLHGTIELALKR